MFTAKHIQSIEKGRTTKASVEKAFGKPKTIGRDDAGLETWGYIYIDLNVPLKGGDVKGDIQRLTLTFDGETVKSFSYEFSE